MPLASQILDGNAVFLILSFLFVVILAALTTVFVSIRSVKKRQFCPDLIYGAILGVTVAHASQFLALFSGNVSALNYLFKYYLLKLVISAILACFIINLRSKNALRKTDCDDVDLIDN